MTRRTRASASQRRRAWRTAAVAAAIAGAAGSLTLASCSLDLDESLIGQAPETGASDVIVADTLVPEGGDGALPPIAPESGVCTRDEDCKGTSGCLAAKCDLPRKACVLQVCRQPACNSGACDVAASKCGAPRPYKYRAAQFPVTGPIGCGSLSRCFAAVYPFVFVGTTNGVVAYPASDPANAAADALPVTGLGFVPTQILASGSRVFFLGTAAGTGATSRVPIAYVDVPPDPFAKAIAVTTVLAAHNRPATDPVTLVARGNDTALLLDLNAASSYPAVPIEPPLAEPAVLTSTTIVFTAGSGPVAVSGSRLIMGQLNPATGAATFGFVNAAGSATPQTQPDVVVPTAVNAINPQVFAQSADGAIFWSYVALNAPPSTLGVAVRAARGYFLVPDGNATTFDATGGLDLEVYGAAPVGTPTVGPVAMLDSKTAMVLTSNPPNPGAVTNVQFVTRQPLALVKNADMAPRRFQITLPVSQLAASGSNGIGYVLAVDPAAPTTPVVHVLDPACAP